MIRRPRLAETLGAFPELIQQGKVRVIGASNYSGEPVVEALKVSKDNGLSAYQSLQPEYNPCEAAPASRRRWNRFAAKRDWE